ncbi:MAG: HK97 family phage prohead protease [Hyphomicrobiales bacterium]|nr:HK97 family phage prohead protease [Hyphomicrobiales bacterium]
MARALAREFFAAARLARETKRAPLALASVDLEGVFEGYASLFGVADLGRDVVEKGAFAASLVKRGPSRVKMLWQHDASEPIGAWLSIVEDARGLKVKGRLNLAVRRAREILALMRDGQVDGLSIGFRTEQATQDRKTGLRHLQKIDLWEISLVTFPMLPQARVTTVKRHSPQRYASAATDRWRRAADAFQSSISRASRRLEARYAEQPRTNDGRYTFGRIADPGRYGTPPLTPNKPRSDRVVQGDYAWGALVTQFDAGGRRICI